MRARRAVAVPVVAVAVVAGAALAAQPAAAAAFTPTTVRVSVATSSAQANNFSESSSISANGRYVAFVSKASNLVSGDTNGVEDVFVRDLVTRTTSRVSVSSKGVQANGSSYVISGAPSISADGRYVAFESRASNLTAGAPYGGVFVRDRVAGTTSLVDVATGGRQSRGGFEPSISANGRYVAFISYASDLVPGDTNNQPDVFVRDRVAGTTTRVSVATGGRQGNGWSGRGFGYSSWSGGIAISADGRYVAFTSNASNLVTGDTNGVEDVFVRDRVAGTTTRISTATGGRQANYNSFEPSVSADGRYVAFTSNASNLVAGDTNDDLDVFVRDRVTGVTSRASVTSKGGQGEFYSDESSISADGRYVTFRSFSSNLVSGDTNNADDSFVRDRVAGTTTRISVATSGGQANRSNYAPMISADGRYLVFDSDASNLVAGDTNKVTDVFVRQLRP